MRARIAIAALGLALSCGVASEPSSIGGGAGSPGSPVGFSAGQSPPQAPAGASSADGQGPPSGVSAEPGFGADGGAFGLGGCNCLAGEVCCERAGVPACVSPQAVGRDCFPFGGTTFPP